MPLGHSDAFLGAKDFESRQGPLCQLVSLGCARCRSNHRRSLTCKRRPAEPRLPATGCLLSSNACGKQRKADHTGWSGNSCAVLAHAHSPFLFLDRGSKIACLKASSASENKRAREFQDRTPEARWRREVERRRAESIKDPASSPTSATDVLERRSLAWGPFVVHGVLSGSLANNFELQRRAVCVLMRATSFAHFVVSVRDELEYGPQTVKKKSDPSS